VWASHGDDVAAVPPGFEIAATSATAPIAAMQAPDRPPVCVALHPEVAHTEHGLEILRNFAYGVCGCTGDWTIASFIEEATNRIRQQVGDGKLVCGLSGGVDSTVAALLIHRAIGDRLTCIFVDNGLLRHDEANQIRKRFTEKMRLPLDFVDATDLFLTRLAGVSPIPSRSGRSSAPRSSTCSSVVPTSLAGSTFSARARSTRTSSKSASVHGPAGGDQEPSQRRADCRSA
jgi:GMP synthase (glutamine-hydrolysing)